MQLDITGRHVEVTPALREFALEKLTKLEKLLDGPLEVHVVLAIEKHRHTAEIQVKSRSAILAGTQETSDLYASIGECVDKLERQALKHKEKIRTRKHRKGPRDLEVAKVIEANASPASISGNPAPAPPARVVERRRYRLKPLAVEDAILELEASQEELLVFREAGTDRIHVVYRQRDGNLGLVAPEF